MRGHQIEISNLSCLVIRNLSDFSICFLSETININFPLSYLKIFYQRKVLEKGRLKEHATGVAVVVTAVKWSIPAHILHLAIKAIAMNSKTHNVTYPAYYFTHYILLLKNKTWYLVNYFMGWLNNG
ncbi:hypothetical protein BpHYR1_012166 [Brachionus plicatilis]|uniref:Uncharacterized protein n=1 Tax=Brachionus plicatilis TaxID=10195 RepID=A0A3M7SCM9_BRAPC|nr:hypothetical protein BpHYR1_012166 [Brachionus plicatilis]